MIDRRVKIITVTILIALASLFITGCVDSLGEAIQEGNYRDRGDKIKVDDAVKLVHGNLLALIQRCPGFETSYFNWPFNYYLFLKDNCADNYDRGENDRNGCADYHFLSRNEVESCRLLIDTDPCEEESATYISNHRLITFHFCANTFRAKNTFPVAGDWFDFDF